MKTAAIIGTGIAGLGCAHLLKERFRLALFEGQDRIGGHSNTIEVREGAERVRVDTGFMVFNKVTYPNLTRLFDQLDAPIMPTTMSFSVQHLPSGIEWNGAGLNRLFGQRKNLFNPRFWRLLLAIDRFNKEAPKLLDDPGFGQVTLRELAARRGYGEDFLNQYLIPMGAAVWSTPPAKMLDFPAATLMRFWKNHGFLGLNTHFQWWTLKGGSREYVTRLTAPFRDTIRLGDPATSVRRLPQGGVEVLTASGNGGVFDKVILACHADEALGILAEPTPAETALLAPFKYQKNIASLHTDPKFMPRERRCWASWNYRVDPDADGTARPPSVHYWMNSLQGVSKRRNYFVSLNSDSVIRPEHLIQNIEYTHPIISREAVAAQADLPSLNRVSPDQAVYFCGSYFKYGFHEDAFTSAINCSRAVANDPSLWS